MTTKYEFNKKITVVTDSLKDAVISLLDNYPSINLTEIAIQKNNKKFIIKSSSKQEN